MAGPLKAYWLVTTELFPFSGGIGVYAHHSMALLQEGGVDATLIFYDPTATQPSVSYPNGYRLIRFHDQTLAHQSIGQPQLHGHLLAAYAACEFIKAMIDEEGSPDVIEFQDYGALAYFFLKHRLIDVPRSAPRVVLTAHRPYIHCAVADDESPFEHRTAFLADAERWCYAAADAILAPSRFIVEALQRPGMGFPIGNWRLVRNPYAVDTIAAAPDDDLVIPQRLELARLQHGPHEPVLMFGKLQNQKGAWDAIASLAALQAQDQPHPLWFWGRDALHSPSGATTYDFLERRYHRLFASGAIRYFGDYALGSLRALCDAHPICLLPYRAECLPYAFIEVVLCGGLPLTTANGGQVELIPQVYRDLLTVDVQAPDRLGARLDRLKRLSRAERRAISDALRAEVIAQTNYAAVRAAKLAALDEIVLTSAAGAYPFVYGSAKIFAAPDPDLRRRLANDVPQRGATVSTIVVPERPGERHGALISVIVPYYEMQAYIGETLDSLEAQTHDNVEIIIVDDGSHSEAAKAKLTAVAGRPSRHRTTILRKYNGGLADARNAGAKIALGDYLYFLDADDTLHPATLARSLAVLNRFSNVSYVGTWLREFGGGEREWIVWDVDGPYIGFHNLQICAFLVRAEAWLRYGVNDPAVSLGMEDYESHVRMQSNDVRGVALPKVYFNYRIRQASMSRAFNAHAMAFLQRQVIANNSEFYTRFGPRLVGMFAENGHGAMATPPTVRTPAHAELFGSELATLQEVEHELEREASRSRLSRALHARAHHGGPAWDYAVARLLLALELEAPFADRLLSQASGSAPQNGWYRLYAIVAHLRSGHADAARALWSPGFDLFCRRERDAVLWVAGLESVRGFPHVNRTFRETLAEGAAGGDALTDPAFVQLRAALDSLLSAACDTNATATILALEACRDASTFLSPEALGALLGRWLLNWRSDNALDNEHLKAFVATVDQDRDTAALVYGRAENGTQWLATLAGRRALAPAAIGPARRPLLRHFRTRR